MVNGDNTDAPPTSLSTTALANPEASLYLVKTRASVTSEYVDGEENSSVLKSRQNVYKELVETEKVYVKDMQTVIDVSRCSVDQFTVFY